MSGKMRTSLGFDVVLTRCSGMRPTKRLRIELRFLCLVKTVLQPCGQFQRPQLRRLGLEVGHQPTAAEELTIQMVV